MGQTPEQIETTVKLVEILQLAARWRNDVEQTAGLPAQGHWMPVMGTTVERDGAYTTQFINCENVQETKLISSSSASKEFSTAVTHHLQVLHKGFLAHSQQMEKEINQSTSIISTLQDSLEQPAKKSIFDLFNALRIDKTVVLIHGTKDANMKLESVKALPDRFSTPLSSVMKAAALTFSDVDRAMAIYELAAMWNERPNAMAIATTVDEHISSIVGSVSLPGVVVNAPVLTGFLTALNVPLFGISFGLTELMKVHGKAAEKIAAVGFEFDKLRNGYTCCYSYSNEIGALHYPHYSVVTKIDLHEQKLYFGSQMIYSSTVTKGLWSSNTPEVNLGKALAFNFREALDLPESIPLTNGSSASLAANILILPSTPKSYIRYTYDNLLGSRFRDDKGFHEVLIPLQERKDFVFRCVVVISEYIINSTTEEYVNTPIEVFLGKSPFRLEIPIIKEAMKGKIEYRIHGRLRGHCTVGLREGVSLMLFGAQEKMLWILDATKLSNSSIVVTETGLTVGNLSIRVDHQSKSEVFVVTPHGGYWSIDFGNSKCQLLWIDAEPFPNQVNKNDDLPLVVYLKTLSPKVAGTQVVRIENYFVRDSRRDIVPVGRAYYDLASRTMFYTYVSKTLEGFGPWSRSAILGPAFKGSDGRTIAYFYDTDKGYLWRVRVDPPTLSDTNVEATFSSPFLDDRKIVKVWMTDNRVLAQYRHRERHHHDWMVYIYRLGPKEMTLFQIVQNKMLNWNYFDKSNPNLAEHPIGESVTTVTAQEPVFVQIVSPYSKGSTTWRHHNTGGSYKHMTEWPIDMDYVGSTSDNKLHYFYCHHQNIVYSGQLGETTLVPLEVDHFPDSVLNPHLYP